METRERDADSHVVWLHAPAPSYCTAGRAVPSGSLVKKGGEVGGQRSRARLGRGQMVARGWTKGPGARQSKKGATFVGRGQPSGRPRPRIFSRIAALGWSSFGLGNSPPVLVHLLVPSKGRQGPKKLSPPNTLKIYYIGCVACGLWLVVRGSWLVACSGKKQVFTVVSTSEMVRSIGDKSKKRDFSS